jgi:hypothetical protein
MKLLLLILILALYSSGLLNSYHFSLADSISKETINNVEQTSSNTDYKIYENPNYGIVLRYPSNWTYEEMDLGYSLPERDFEVVFFSPTQFEDEGTLTSVILDELGSRHLTLEQYKDERINNLKMDAEPQVKDLSVTATKLDGSPAYRIEYRIWILDHWDNSTDILSVVNNEWREISIIGTPKSIQFFSEPIENLVKSVKFNSQTSASRTL